MLGSLAGAAGKLAVQSAAVSMTFGAAAASMALAGGYAANRAYHSTLGRNGTITWHQNRLGTIAGRTLNAPVPRMTRTFQNTLIGGGMAGSLGMGAVDHFQEKRWNLERSLATGAIEIERPDFMGASGSLVLASRRRRSALPPNHEGVLTPHALHIAHIVNDIAYATL